MLQRVSLVAVLALLSVVPSAEAWGFKEHIQLSRMAVGRLLDDPKTPPEMKTWLKTLVPDPRTPEAEREWFLRAKIGEAPVGLSPFEHFVILPDLRSKTDKKEKVPPVNIPERMSHFLDMEIFVASGKPRKYSDDLAGKAPPDAIPDDPTDARFIQAGALPFAVERSYDELVKSIRDGRLAFDPAKPNEEDNAVRWAGFLAHYLQDNCQPLHATEDYKSASYFPNRRTAPNVHAAMEYRMNDDAAQDYPELRAEFWDVFVRELATLKDPITTDDPWKATVEVSSLSYDALPLIGAAAVASAGAVDSTEKAAGKSPELPINITKFFHFEGVVRRDKMTVLQLKARQQAWALLRTERLFKQAWAEAHTSAKPAN